MRRSTDGAPEPRDEMACRGNVLEECHKSQIKQGPPIGQIKCGLNMSHLNGGRISMRHV